MRTAATARPRRPSDGKNRWVTETDADALWEANTQSESILSLTG